MTERLAIPAAVRRQVIVEAGDRCAIHTCRQFPVEVAHIRPWSETQDHSPVNLIALCPNCHTRYDSGSIPRDRIQVYKDNTIKNQLRFNGFEIAILESFLPNTEAVFALADNMDFLLSRLRHNRLVETVASQGSFVMNGVAVGPRHFQLTPTGKSYVSKMAKGERLE